MSDRPSTKVTRATRKRLKEAGALATPLGETALVLAARVDSGEESGNALAQVARELRLVLAAVEASGAGGQPDVVDELKARREARLRASAGR